MKEVFQRPRELKMKKQEKVIVKAAGQ